MKIQFECSAILFDLDGVLVDSTRSVTRQWRMWAVEKGLDPDEVVRMAHGVRTIEVIRKMAPHLPLEEETRKLEKREADDIEGVAVMPGAADLLRSIPENRWCVVTSGTRYLATSRLRFGNLPIPKVMVTADEVSQGKPGHRRRARRNPFRARGWDEGDCAAKYVSCRRIAGCRCGYGCAGCDRSRPQWA
jgi:sugar-phosphatase